VVKAEYRPRLYGAGVLARGAHACRRAGSAGHRRGGDGLEQKLAIAEARLAGSRYLVGDTFTLADIQFGHVLYRYFAIHRRPLPTLRRIMHG
jgi:glutathione S-transferase